MEFDGKETLVLAVLTLFLGKYLNRKVGFLRSYNIPEPVTGGVLASVVFAALYSATGSAAVFDLSNRDVLLVVFFTTVGLNAKFATLLAGGKPLVILIVCASLFLVAQNLTGVTVVSLLGGTPVIGLLGGSISLSGGHGTAIAWTPIFQDQLGIENAKVIGIAVATFGLVIGGIIGGPLSQFLIDRYRLEPAEGGEDFVVGLPDEPADDDTRTEGGHHLIDADTILVCLLVIAIAMGIGFEISDFGEAMGLKLPDFVGALFAGILLTNLVPLASKRLPWPSGSKSLALISDVSLSLFLAMSLMSLQLWSIFAIAGPLTLLLLAQLAMISAFVIFVIFPLMGRSYDAAVMAGGYAGLGLGATPTAVANMTAVTRKCGPSPLAFLIVPLVGAFFIDIANAAILKGFISWLS